MNCGKGASDRQEGRDSGWSKRLEQRMAHHNCTTTNNLFLTTSGEEFAVYIMVYLQYFLVPFDFVDPRSPKDPNFSESKSPIVWCAYVIVTYPPNLAPPVVTCSPT